MISSVATIRTSVWPHGRFYGLTALSLGLPFLNACLTVNLPALQSADESSAQETESSSDDLSDTANQTTPATTSSNVLTNTSATTSGATTTLSTTSPSSQTTSVATDSSATIPSESGQDSASSSDTTSPDQTPNDSTPSTTSDSSTTDTSTTTTSDTPTITPVNAARIVVSTKSYGGHYAPHNAGVLWIENAAGQQVDTLIVWAKLRRRHLEAWKAGFGGELGDAIAGATAPDHVEHEVVWDLRDLSGTPVADGDYHLRGEFTEENSDEDDVADGPTFDLPFRLSRTSPQPLEQFSETGFVHIRLSYE